MRRAWAALATAALLVTVVPTGAVASAAEPATTAQLRGSGTVEPARPSTSAQLRGSGDGQHPPQLRREGRWLVDRQGRVVIIHGLNMVWKLKPYVPPNSRAGFQRRDADWLARHGFNGARIGTLWAGVTPKKPGQGDPSYRRRWQRVMDLLDRRGIWMQLDAHQDQWHEIYGGEGVPRWAVHRPAPYSSAPPVTAPFPTGYWTPETSTVFDNFWADKEHTLDGWVASWKVATRWWHDQPHLMGYDLLNEPWMGREWPTCLSDGCRSSIRRELQPAFEKATRAIRRIDHHNIVWWEPQQFAGGQALETYLTRMRGERQLGFSWHNYCPQVFLESQGVPGADARKCLSFSRGREKHALRQARTMRAAPMMSEWGATDNLTAIKLDAQAADESLMGWTHWAYKQWNDPTTADTAQGLFHNDRNLGSAKRGKLRLLVRTYAQATAGTPLRMTFRPRHGAFDYRYRADRGISAPTVIFVSPLHYPHGYRVHVDGGRVVRRDGHRLYVRPTSPGVVHVRIRGAGRH